MKPRCSRRDFLRIGTGTLMSSAMASTLPVWSRTLDAAATSGYKALVCLYMTGGNDGFNWFVPVSDAGFQTYKTSRRNIALPAVDTVGGILPLRGPGATAATASDGYQYGINPSCPELKALFDSGNMAVLCNVGTLIAPVTQSTVMSGSAPLPPQLFSHIDQQTQWYTSDPTTASSIGWAGRVADYYSVEQGYNPRLAMNIDVGVQNYMQQGAKTNMYVLGTGGAPVLDATRSSYRNGARATAAKSLLALAQNDPNQLVKTYWQIADRAANKVNIVNDALSAVGDIVTTFTDPLDYSKLGAQLHEVARVIKAQSQIGDGRQIFFVSIDGFDTHNNELSTQKSLLAAISLQLSTFYAAMVALGQQNNVTVFSTTEFGRTITSNSDGADHAWGNHHIILGGAVKGGQYYGKMPSLVIGGPDDFTSHGIGQMIPTTSTDQYAATLAAWFGVPTSALGQIFPNLGHFSTPTLGFL